VHGTAHVGMSCALYVHSIGNASDNQSNKTLGSSRGAPSRRRFDAAFQTTTTTTSNAEDDLTARALATWTKPCSHCGCRLQKAAGCDHVICPSCRQDLCWRCGTHVHLTGHVVRHCAQCQRDYRDHRYDHVYRFRLALCLPILLPLFLVYSVILLGVATITGCFCGCFRCGRCLVLQTKPTTAAVATAPPPSSSLTPTPSGVSTASTSSSAAAGSVPASAATKVRGSPRHGIWATIVIVFLPVIALLEDFGFHVPILDELFPEQINNTEMPYLEVEMTA
jgi:hypothetical protein